MLNIIIVTILTINLPMIYNCEILRSTKKARITSALKPPLLDANTVPVYVYMYVW